MAKDSNIQMSYTWTFDLQPDAARLVLRALGGRIKDEAELKAAKELGDRLTKQRAVQTAHIAEEMRKHAANIEDPA